jgi:hypothetical protein
MMMYIIEETIIDMTEEGDNKKKEPHALAGEMIKDIRKIILERQTISQAAWQKFAELANQESADPFKKSVAEDLAAIHFSINTIWLEIERLYTFELINTEKIKELYGLIFMVPGVMENKEVTNRMRQKVGELDKWVKSLREGMR